MIDPARLEVDYLDAIADFVCSTRLEDIPEAVLDEMRITFADTLAVIAAGMQTREMKALLSVHAPLTAPGAACVIGSGCRMNPLDAAGLNGTAGVFLELDSGNSQSHGHPGIHCLPSALAVAQATGASGAETLLACVVGYEVCARVGGAAKMRIMVQPHGTYGVLGAAMTVAKMRGLSHAQVRSLINVAGATPIGGNRQTMLDGATVRNWYAGHSSQMGQMAVRLAEAGFTGPHAALDVTFGQVLGDAFDSASAISGTPARATSSCTRGRATCIRRSTRCATCSSDSPPFRSTWTTSRASRCARIVWLCSAARRWWTTRSAPASPCLSHWRRCWSIGAGTWIASARQRSQTRG